MENNENIRIQYIRDDLKAILPPDDYEFISKLETISEQIIKEMPGEHLTEKEVILLHRTTYRLPDKYNLRMCTQRGYKTEQFKNELVMKAYTSAEFAKERYNIDEKVYFEILNFQNEEFHSDIKDLLLQIYRIAENC